MKTIQGRCMYVWKLKPVLTVELGIDNFVRRAQSAHLSGVWIKVAEGETPYTNVTGPMKDIFTEVCHKLHAAGIDVWGWHVPKCATIAKAKKEAIVVAELAILIVPPCRERAVAAQRQAVITG